MYNSICQAPETLFFSGCDCAAGYAPARVAAGARDQWLSNRVLKGVENGGAGVAVAAVENRWRA
jgi:hypothetical protein